MKRIFSNLNIDPVSSQEKVDDYDHEYDVQDIREDPKEDDVIPKGSMPDDDDVDDDDGGLKKLDRLDRGTVENLIRLITFVLYACVL